MAKLPDVKSVMVEINRFGVSGGTLQEGTHYIRTTGYDEPAHEIAAGLSYHDFEAHLYALRYSGAASADIDAALDTFEREADKMLGDLPLFAGGLTQIDLVTGAGELWAFPFEAYTRSKPGVVLTRRIRCDVRDHVPWPPEPKILFAHAAIDVDLTRELVDEHIAALQTALRPWTGGGDPVGKQLVVEQLYSLEDLEKIRKTDFTHIHLLAHGTPVPKSGPASLQVWGMRLGRSNAVGVHPREVAAALAPRNGLPVAITVASCDSANQSESAAASWSVAQELHRLGVPVVLASQLPLTMHGSVLLARHFYEPLLCGQDVRIALDNVRLALRHDAQAHHDWLSLVAYVRLPENYQEHLGRVGLKMELAMLRAAQNRADEVIATDALDELDDIERLIGERIDSLAARLENLKNGEDRLECQGLLASAYKRLAELLFLGKRDPAEQRQALQASLQHYSAAFRSNPHKHWQGVQQLALQAALNGSFDPLDYAIVMRSAKRAAEADPNDYWPQGTLAELYLLAALVGQQPSPDEARAAVELFKQLAAGKENDIDSTRRQLRRYVDWWTAANGYQTNLGEQAAALAALLPKEDQR